MKPSYSYLNPSPYRPKANSLVVGRNPIMEALGKGISFERIYLQSNASGESISQIRQLAKAQQIPINYVPVQKLNSLSTLQHQGCIGFCAAIRYIDLQEQISYGVEKGGTPLFLLLESITDVRNIGAIARTAWCAGVDGLVIPDKGVAPLREDAIKASAGALEHIAVSRVGQLIEAISILHSNGIKLFAADAKATKRIDTVDFTEPAAILMGGEDVGISAAVMAQCDTVFKIPITNQFDSFNVSVAAGIALYEVNRQRLNLS